MVASQGNNYQEEWPTTRVDNPDIPPTAVYIQPTEHILLVATAYVNEDNVPLLDMAGVEFAVRRYNTSWDDLIDADITEDRQVNGAQRCHRFLTTGLITWLQEVGQKYPFQPWDTVAHRPTSMLLDYAYPAARHNGSMQPIFDMLQPLVEPLLAARPTALFG